MKKRIKTKFFNTNEEYFNFIKKDGIKVLSVTFTHNFKIKVVYAIIK